MTQTRRKRGIPALRLLFDEPLSGKVARALGVLDFHVIRVGQEWAPPYGASDTVIVEFARQRNQVIVTSNHDMMTLCHEESVPFVWLDPRGKQLHLEEQVLLVFKQIREWDRLFAEGAECVRAMRTKCEAMPAEEAARLVTNRMRKLEQRQRKKQAKETQKERLAGMD